MPNFAIVHKFIKKFIRLWVIVCITIFLCKHLPLCLQNASCL